MTRLYRTRLFSLDNPQDIKLPRYKARGWDLHFDVAEYKGRIEDPRFRRWELALRSDREKHNLPAPVLSLTPNGVYADAEISIRAKDRTVAQYALKLILLGELLATREQVDMEGHYVVPPDSSEPWPEDHPAIGARRVEYRMSSGLTNAALIGARLSQRNKWQSAAWKYFYACKQCPISWRDTHPHYSDYRPISGNPEEFVLYANSIVSAYSVIEDLGLELRADKKNPSLLPGGVKNPKPLHDLEKRLRVTGVDPNWEVPWQLRTPHSRLTKTEKSRARRLSGPGAPCATK